MPPTPTGQQIHDGFAQISLISLCKRGEEIKLLEQCREKTDDWIQGLAPVYRIGTAEVFRQIVLDKDAISGAETTEAKWKKLMEEKKKSISVVVTDLRSNLVLLTSDEEPMWIVEKVIVALTIVFVNNSTSSVPLIHDHYNTAAQSSITIHRP